MRLAKSGRSDIRIASEISLFGGLSGTTDNVTSQSNPVFVVGTVRSGTSLLYTLLNQHPRIGLMFELDVWDFPQLLQGLRFRGNWLERQEFYNNALSRHRLILAQSLRGLEKARSQEELYRIFSEGKGAKFWGEKSPF